MPRTTKGRTDEPSAVYWFLVLDDALQHGQEELVLQARAELMKLGVTIVVDGDSPLRRRRAPVTANAKEAGHA